jgi:hypothetical protein
MEASPFMPRVTTQESLENKMLIWQPLHSGMMSFANPRNKISSNDDETIENFDNTLSKETALHQS